MLPLKKRLDVLHFFTVQFAFILRSVWELPIHTAMKKKIFLAKSRLATNDVTGASLLQALTQIAVADSVP